MVSNATSEGIPEGVNHHNENYYPSLPDSFKGIVLDGYRRLSARRVDLVGDFAGQELFIVEGDSLLLHCFSNSLLDFQDGFQMLHAVYLVEEYLSNLRRRSCRFNVAFFDAHKQLCIPEGVSQANESKYLLTRAAIIRHLQANMPGELMETKCFPTPHDQSFKDYLYSTAAYFLMCHDGAGYAAQGKIPRSEDKKQNGDTDPRVDLRAMIMRFLLDGYNVALINSSEFIDTKVFAMVLQPGTISESLAETLEDEETLSTPVSSTSDTAVIEKAKALESGLTERERLVLVVLSHLLSSSSASELQKFAYSMLVHMALLSSLPLSARSLEHVSLPEGCSEIFSSFNTEAANVLESPSWSATSESKSDCDVSDIIDGRLLNVILSGFSSSQLPADAQTKLNTLVDALKTVSDKTVEEGTKHGEANGAKSSSQPPAESSRKQLSVLPFSNPVFDQHLQTIRLGVDETADEELSRPSARVFQELTHWHNAKRPIMPKGQQVVLSPRDEMRTRRRNQRFMDEMQKYAASLTNSVGRALEPETILVKSGQALKAADRKTESDRSNPKPQKEDKKGPPKGGKNAVKRSGKQAVMDQIAATHAKKSEAINSKVTQAWQVTLKSLSAEPEPAFRFVKTNDYLKSLPKEKRDFLGAEVQLFALNCLVELSFQLAKANRPDLSGIVALIWHNARNLAQSEFLTKTIADNLKLTVETFALPPVDIPQMTEERALSFKYALPVRKSEAKSNELSSKDFQLMHCGPYLDRSIDSAPDSRVEFEPDGWQREVLDGIDSNSSLFVVAPTSAGKTFISFYAMRKVLEADDDGVLVYVAPTKALVNQIAAEIQARYSKKFKYPGRGVWAIHTRDHRINNPTGCQVLVTVPHVLQIMLLAPSHADSWAPRVKRIIFDEVHCIGQAEDGVVWEQLLLLAPCPVIALSATVGNPEVFSDWLSSTEKSMGIDFKMVKHSTRYSDLRKFFYNPPKKFSFEGLVEKKGSLTLGLDGTAGFEHVHPVASLVNRAAGIPDDLSLEPRDCFTLWLAMKEHTSDKFFVSTKLDPANALPKVIRKRDVLAWEANLKQLLASWMADPDSPFEAVFKTLAGKPMAREEVYSSTSTVTAGEATLVVGDDTTLPLLCRLHEQEALPAILFRFDRTECETTCAKLQDDLKEAEDRWKESSPKWKSKLKRFEAWKVEQSKKKGAKVSKVKKSADAGEDRMSKADSQRDAAEADHSSFESFDPEAPVEGFHFCDYRAVQASELEAYLEELQWRHIDKWLIVALSRGIAVHHAGMNRKYRQVVEILFRKGFLRVVIATGTLALGINMPCKTVVFSGDSVFLTALNYRQCAGRAGRRGFDLLGNVVFQNMTRDKVARLMSSKLPDLNGHFPITTTLVLRLFTLLHGSKGSKFAMSSINSLLSQPRLYMGGPSFKDQTLHHLRFSIEYLRRQHLLDAKGATLNFAGLVSHLYFTENSSFAFHALLKEGYFHKLCADIDNNEQGTIETLMLVMSHLFGRKYCRKSDEEYKEKVVKPSSSIVFLPPLPADAANVLKEHGQQTLDIFTTYVHTFVDQHVNEPDNALPLTGGHVKSSGEQTVSGLPTLPQTKIRSPFVALSGHSDEFKSISELCRSVRSGVFLEESAIPHVAMLHEELEQPLNAYLLDFFKHGDTKTLEIANGIGKGDVWFMLNDFSLVMATIITSLMNFMKLKTGSDMDFLDTMGELDALEEAEDENVADHEEGTTKLVVNDSTTRPEKPIISKKKAKNADSWEDMANEEEEVEATNKKIDEAAEKLKQALELEDPAWEGMGGEKGLMKVLKTFQKLHADFNIKFKAMWA